MKSQSEINARHDIMATLAAIPEHSLSAGRKVTMMYKAMMHCVDDDVEMCKMLPTYFRDSIELSRLYYQTKQTRALSHLDKTPLEIIGAFFKGMPNDVRNDLDCIALMNNLFFYLYLTRKQTDTLHANYNGYGVAHTESWVQRR